ncbi:MAG TPA: hypothetical protein VK694_00110 [Verrucomicrobiae bacterium]|nr:hypothetical protein [Verrucomicrobiae bacterium]
MSERGEDSSDNAQAYLEDAQELYDKIVAGEVRLEDLPPALQAAFEEEDTDFTGATGTASAPY